MARCLTYELLHTTGNVFVTSSRAGITPALSWLTGKLRMGGGTRLFAGVQDRVTADVHIAAMPLPMLTARPQALPCTVGQFTSGFCGSGLRYVLSR